MFSAATVQTAMGSHFESMSYIDNREFPGIVGEVSPGPIGYLVFAASEALSIFYTVMYFLTAWLADGLLVSSLLDAAFSHPGS